MDSLSPTIIRILAFVRKEIFEILRQPRLLFTLILGPFFILLVFGIGYRNIPRELRTLFVMSEDSALRDRVEEYGTTLGPQLIYAGVTDDEEEALEKLKNGSIDLVAVAPPDAPDIILSNQPAVFTLYHREIDPLQVEYVRFFGKTYMEEINRRVLVKIAQLGQSDAASIQDNMEAARREAERLQQALESDKFNDARQYQARLSHYVDAVYIAVGSSLSVLSGIEDELGTTNGTEPEEALSRLEKVRDDINYLDDLLTRLDNPPPESERVAQIQQDLSMLESHLDQFTDINASVLVRPFRSEPEGVSPIQPTAPEFFAPAVIALLLQHIAVTFAALSIVGERRVGAMELFRVAPLTAHEILFGKYLSFMILGIALTALLTLILTVVLGVPMIGSWYQYSMVIAILLMTSLGIGFVISSISQTTSQAVLFTMIILLTSVFFSGFMVSLFMIWDPVRILSWTLPTTYGIVMLRDIFFRGNPADPVLLGRLTAIGLGLGLLAWVLLRRITALNK